MLARSAGEAGSGGRLPGRRLVPWLAGGRRATLGDWPAGAGAGRARGLLLTLWLVLATSSAQAGEPFSRQVELHPDHPVGTRYMEVALCGALALAAVEVEGVRVGGLSGLAWDRRRQRLEALSDRGHLFELRLRWRRGRLVAAEVLRAVALRGPEGAPLVGAEADAEGLALVVSRWRGRRRTELFVSFEQRPRVWRFGLDGRFLREEPLPALWTEVTAYRGPNLALEAVAWHSRWGLVFGGEAPLRGQPRQTLPLGAAGGETWQLAASAAVEESGLVDLAPWRDGALLLLERGYVASTGRTVISLSRWTPRPPRGASEAPQATDRLVVLDSAEGWAIDNFEGLAALPGGRVLLVSDDNESARQRTLLLCLRPLGRRGASWRRAQPSAKGRARRAHAVIAGSTSTPTGQ
ncbi:MAG: esterase-like activity of phytase family protein [Proteobacteria bacterium]|nr:esterase-like activity of phytase family protein [Pseudomonadota bacterium]